jgi:SulP family sulfate permease
VEEGAARAPQRGGDLYFHRPRAPVLELWQRIGFLGELGTDHIFRPSGSRSRRSSTGLDRGICAHCTVRVFEECKTLPPPVAPIA